MAMEPPLVLFQSTPPARGATYYRNSNDAKRKISIHAPREGGDAGLPSAIDGTAKISIHAPREGGDDLGRVQRALGHISIHAPREGGDVRR